MIIWASPIMLTTTTRDIRVKDREPELTITSPTEVVVVRVILTESNRCILDRNRTTKPFNTVIVVRKYFYIFDSCSATYTTKCKTIDLITVRDNIPTVTDRNVANYTRVVCVIGTTEAGFVLISRNTFNVVCTTWASDSRITKNDQTTPKTTVNSFKVSCVFNVILLRSEDDRLISCTFSEDLSANRNNQSRSGISSRRRSFCFDNCSFFNIQSATIF